MDVATKAVRKLPGSDGLFSPRWSANGKFIAALSIDQKRLLLFDVADEDMAGGGAAEHCGSVRGRTMTQRFTSMISPQADQPIYKVTVATGKIERVADLHDLRLANVVDYRFAGLAPGDVPLVSARMSTANIYAAELPR